ncbi:Cytochrome P450 2B19 [Halotydeus destructor]|nr:Cytochrome P450 2B19 [Halotydeus destructor]
MTNSLITRTWSLLTDQDTLQNPYAWLIGLAVGLITFVIHHLVTFYNQLSEYPNGPLPLPLIGNALKIRGSKLHKIFTDFADQYGAVFTFWMGKTPGVSIANIDAAHEAYLKKMADFAGRPEMAITKPYIGDKGKDLIFTDYGRTWEVLRRVTMAAVRRYSVSEKLSVLVADVIDQVMEEIKRKHGEKPFKMLDYLYLMTYNIIAQSAFGEKFELDDKIFLQLLNDAKFFTDNTEQFFMLQSMPVLKYLPYFSGLNKQMIDTFTRQREMVLKKYRQHLSTYREGEIRDFADALIAGKIEAEADMRDSAEHLNDDNLALTLSDLFLAGTDTTKTTMHWMLLFLAKYPQMQKKVRDEIDEVLGDQILGPELKSRLNYTQAFISETLRFRPILPIGLPHKATVDSSIAGHPIKKGTQVSMIHWAILHDPKHWDKPEVFRPERFLDADGVHNSRMLSFVPFGLGRRACVGEKLALVDMLYMVVRIMQQTRGYVIEPDGGPEAVSVDGDPKNVQPVPLDFEVVIKKVK